MSSFLSGIVGSIGHVSPTLKFDEILVSKYFGTPKPLYQFIYTSYKRSALLQAYKVMHTCFPYDAVLMLSLRNVL